MWITAELLVTRRQDDIYIIMVYINLEYGLHIELQFIYAYKVVMPSKKKGPMSFFMYCVYFYIRINLSAPSLSGH
jgi:hypothetical protein